MGGAARRCRPYHKFPNFTYYERLRFRFRLLVKNEFVRVCETVRERLPLRILFLFATICLRFYNSLFDRKEEGFHKIGMDQTLANKAKTKQKQHPLQQKLLKNRFIFTAPRLSYLSTLLIPYFAEKQKEMVTKNHAKKGNFIPRQTLTNSQRKASIAKRGFQGVPD